ATYTPSLHAALPISQARGYSRDVGASVSGGNADLQYYIGGFYQDQLGTAKMPEVNRVWIENARGDKVKEELIRPNALTKAGLERSEEHTSELQSREK